jgi:hypothetical protein
MESSTGILMKENIIHESTKSDVFGQKLSMFMKGEEEVPWAGKFSDYVLHTFRIAVRDK